MDHLALEHPRFSPTNRSSEDLDIAMSAAARLLAATPAPGPPGWPVGDGLLTSARGRSKQEGMNARLAAGEHPWDMISLKAAIQAARPGRLVSALRSITHRGALQSCASMLGSRERPTLQTHNRPPQGSLHRQRCAQQHDTITSTTLQSQASAFASMLCMRRLSSCMRYRRDW